MFKELYLSLCLANSKDLPQVGRVRIAQEAHVNEDSHASCQVKVGVGSSCLLSIL